MIFLSEKSLEVSTASRLKWRVCALLGIKPYSAQWRRLTRRRVLMCALQLAQDAMQTGGREQETLCANPNFDESKFNELKEGRVCSDS